MFERNDVRRVEISQRERDLADEIRRLVRTVSEWRDLLKRPNEMAAVLIELRDRFCPRLRDLGLVRVDLFEPDGVLVTPGTRDLLPFVSSEMGPQPLATFIIHVVREEDFLQEKKELGVDSVHPIFLSELVSNDGSELWVVGLGRVIQVHSPQKSKWKELFTKVREEIMVLSQPVIITPHCIGLAFNSEEYDSRYAAVNNDLSTFLVRHWEDFSETPYLVGWLDYLTSAGFEVCIRKARYPFENCDEMFLSKLKDYSKFLSDTAPVGIHCPVESQEFEWWLEDAIAEFSRNFWAKVIEGILKPPSPEA